LREEIEIVEWNRIYSSIVQYRQLL